MTKSEFYFSVTDFTQDIHGVNTEALAWEQSESESMYKDSRLEDAHYQARRKLRIDAQYAQTALVAEKDEDGRLKIVSFLLDSYDSWHPIEGGYYQYG